MSLIMSSVWAMLVDMTLFFVKALVEQVKKRGRVGSKYIHKDNPEKVLSTREWRALPKEERDNYTKSEAAKGVVERVSYAKVWGERAKDNAEREDWGLVLDNQYMIGTKTSL